MPRRSEQNFVLQQWSPHLISRKVLKSRLEIMLCSTAVVLHHLPENCFLREARRPVSLQSASSLSLHPAAPPSFLHNAHSNPLLMGFFPQNHSERDECILKTRCTIWKAWIRKWSMFSTVYYFLIILAHLLETDSSPSNNKLIHMEYW